MNQHSPTPWTVGEPINGNPAIYGADGLPVACLSEFSGGGDAALVAASPALLAACHLALANLDYLQNLWGKEAITYGVANVLRKAVNKAAGGTP